MESLDPAACFVDDLLDFSSDIGEDDDDDHKRRTRSSSSLLVGGHSRSLPDPPVEEELEWLNKDVFPGVETFLDYLPTSVENVPKQQSPISVLENSSHSSSSNNSNSSSTTTIMSCCENFRVPSRARSKRCRRRHKDFSDIPGQPWWCGVAREVPALPSGENPPMAGRPPRPKTLCNACGVRYKSGRLVAEYRPASSPTFSSKVHSNSHRKIMEMRKLKQRDVVVRPCG
ncbi:GATA transcription factor 1 [Vitis vinifera]|uniref:GATA transcription factor 1 n=1 Tax=Vitis vinifera TaxID=29760 RepID=A0A438BRI8_VITVI|nr:GATA transcription factor 1 [Vitis vinifera]